MKKIFSILLLIAVLSSPVLAFADGTTELTTFVPEAEYTLLIPGNMEIPYKSTQQTIGTIDIASASGFAEGKNLRVTVTYSPFTSPTTSTSIPYSLSLYANGAKTFLEKKLSSGGTFLFQGSSYGSLSAYSESSNTTCKNFTLEFNATAASWGKALGGAYSSAITFTSEVYVE